MSYTMRFAHGPKANVDSAIQAGTINEDDIIIFSDTDDEIGFINHDNIMKPIKARTNKDYVLNGVSFGALEDGDKVPSGSSIDDFLDLITKKIIHPTYTSPEISITSNSDELEYEVGTTIDVTLTAEFAQNDAGAIESIKIKKDDIELASDTTSTLTKEYQFEIKEGNNTFSSIVEFAQGDIKKNNLDEDDSNGRIDAGSISADLSFIGQYRYFYGVSENSEIDIDNLTSSIGIENDTIINIDVPIGSKKIAFAYPSSLRDVSKIEYLEMNDFKLKNIFSKETISYKLPNDSEIEYKLYTYEMAVPAAASMTIKATI